MIEVEKMKILSLIYALYVLINVVIMIMLPKSYLEGLIIVALFGCIIILILGIIFDRK